MTYRVAVPSDYQAIAKIHKKSFDGFFLTELGDEFLELYYKTVLNSEETFAVCALDENSQLIGFATGCKNSIGYNKRLLLNNFLSYLFFIIKYLLIKPSKLYRLIKNFSKKAYKFDDGNYCELYSIAVLHDFKNKGIGDKLINQFENIAKKNKVSKITLTTDYFNNDYVIQFYKNKGFIIYYDFYTYPNRRMYKLIKDI